MVDRRYARYGLAAVRILNGALGLFAPAILIKRFDPAAEPNPAAVYGFRLFGVRTIILGLDLLVRPEAEVQRALREGVVIHASDLLTVVALGVTHKIPPRTAIATTAISGTNVALAVAGLGRTK